MKQDNMQDLYILKNKHIPPALYIFITDNSKLSETFKHEWNKLVVKTTTPVAL